MFKIKKLISTEKNQAKNKILKKIFKNFAWFSKNKSYYY